MIRLTRSSFEIACREGDSPILPRRLGNVGAVPDGIETASRGRWLVLAAMVLAVAGCRSGVELGGVQGRVTKNGQPQAKMWVEFRPMGGGRPAEGYTDSDGRYELRYTGERAGALVGKHRVRVFSGGELDSRDNQLSPRKQIYSREVEVEPGDNTVDLELADP
jgi:hypothetical protein